MFEPGAWLMLAVHREQPDGILLRWAILLLWGYEPQKSLGVLAREEHHSKVGGARQSKFDFTSTRNSVSRSWSRDETPSWR